MLPTSAWAQPRAARRAHPALDRLSAAARGEQALVSHRGHGEQRFMRDYVYPFMRT